MFILNMIYARFSHVTLEISFKQNIERMLLEMPEKQHSPFANKIDFYYFMKRVLIVTNKDVFMK